MLVNIRPLMMATPRYCGQIVAMRRAMAPQGTITARLKAVSWWVGLRIPAPLRCAGGRAVQGGAAPPWIPPLRGLVIGVSVYAYGCDGGHARGYGQIVTYWP